MTSKIEANKRKIFWSS